MPKKYLKTLRKKYVVSTINEVVNNMKDKGLVYDEESAYVQAEVMKENGY